MTAVVAVVDPLPMYRQGVAAVLSGSGHRVEMPADVLAWVRQNPGSIVLLTLESEHGWDSLAGLAQMPEPPLVIALLEQDAADSGALAVRAGARSVLWRTSSASTVLRAVEAIIDGQVLLPAAVAAALTAREPASGGNPSLPDPQQLAWLRRLAAGSTVAQLATRAGYSERAMFRLLRTLYHDLGVATRTEAIVRAQELGWLTAGRRTVAAPSGGSGVGTTQRVDGGP